MKTLTYTQINKLDLLYCEYNEGVITFEQYELGKALILNS